MQNGDRRHALLCSEAAGAPGRRIPTSVHHLCVVSSPASKRSDLSLARVPIVRPVQRARSLVRTGFFFSILVLLRIIL
jgi:hypothetical protein